MIGRFPVLAIPAGVAWVAAWFATRSTGYRRSTDPLFPWVTEVHSTFIDRASRWGGDGGELVPGLVLGNTESVSESLAEAMRVTSLTHLMAVSGANCAIVVGLAFGVAALCQLAIVGRVAVSAVALALFVVLVGPEPSVIRSSIMAAIGLAALVGGRTVAGISALCAAVIMALAFDPTLAHSLGFALSVSATLGLLVIARPLAAVVERWVPRPLALLVSVPVSAALACQPIIVAFSPFIPTYGVLANLLAEPLVPIATVCGLLSILFNPIPGLSDGLLAIACSMAELIASIARGLAGLPVARIAWPGGSFGVVLATLVTAGTVTALTPRFRRLGVLVAVCAATAGLSITVGATRLAWAFAPGQWSWAQCDVGQGDAIVIRDSGRVALIDTGRFEPAVRECLDALGIGHIDLLVLTHFDIDHVGGYESIVGRVGTVLHGPTDGVADETILGRVVRGGARPVVARRGLAGELGRLTWHVLWPTETNPREPGNPSSVVLVFERGPDCDVTCVTGITLGDLPAAEQSAVRLASGVTAVDIVKVSHHGSRDQDPELYRRAGAAIALIGVGADNTYGHPTEQTLDMLTGTGSSVARSDINGITLVWRTASGELRVWRERQSEPRFTLTSEE